MSRYERGEDQEEEKDQEQKEDGERIEPQSSISSTTSSTSVSMEKDSLDSTSSSGVNGLHYEGSVMSSTYGEEEGENDGEDEEQRYSKVERRIKARLCLLIKCATCLISILCLLYTTDDTYEWLNRLLLLPGMTT